MFFDVSSLNEYVPSIEFITFEEYLQEVGYIDEVSVHAAYIYIVITLRKK